MPSSDYIDTIEYNDLSDEEEDITIYDEPLEYQTWCTWFREDLLNMWMSIRTYAEDSYMRSTLLGPMCFEDFCSFVYSFSSTYPSKKAK